MKNSKSLQLSDQVSKQGQSKLETLSQQIVTQATAMLEKELDGMPNPLPKQEDLDQMSSETKNLTEQEIADLAEKIEEEIDKKWSLEENFAETCEMFLKQNQGIIKEKLVEKLQKNYKKTVF